jgi:phage shock protein E
MSMLIDVRTQEEFNEGHAHNVAHIPLDQILENKLGAIAEQSKDAQLYLHCRSGGRSGQAVDHLKTLGYTNVHNVGGLDQVLTAQSEGKEF